MKVFRFGISILLFLVASPSFGAMVSYTEAADQVRFEQYTASGLVLWRMPTPGQSVFPGGSCIALEVPGTTEKASRFMALYMFAKSTSRSYFVNYDTSTCQIISFGMDG